MGYVYVAFSLKLNERSFEETGQVFLFKFGYARVEADLQRRLNEGFEERWRQDHLGERSAPLALCDDWQILECLEHDSKLAAKTVETAILDWCRRHFSPVELVETLKGEINARVGESYPSSVYVSWNGIGDIVCLDRDLVADDAYLASVGRPNDLLATPLVDRAIAIVRRELRAFALGPLVHLDPVVLDPQVSAAA